MTDDAAEDKSKTANKNAKDPGESSQLSPALIATLVAIPVMVLVGIITFVALKARAPEVPVDNYATASSQAAVDGYKSTGNDAQACAEFIAKLPDSFGTYDHKQVDGDRVTWSPVKTDNDSERSDQPVVLRCGVERPANLAPTSALQVIDPVQWFITDSINGEGQAYVAVDRRPYVAVWLPQGSGNAPITDISGVIAQHLSAAPLDLGK